MAEFRNLEPANYNNEAYLPAADQPSYGWQAGSKLKFEMNSIVCAIGIIHKLDECC